MEPLSHKKLDFEEFCVAAISTYQLEAHEGWEKIASTAFEYFESEGNRVISAEELAQVCTSVFRIIAHVDVTFKIAYGTRICMSFTFKIANSRMMKHYAGNESGAYLLPFTQ